ncbi:hypothetical protein [Halorussus lipolyticus]|uniref:hypothetical protein n=1 Tax=Halorussus lipolyticus TaxID=3034024 RepID=UPI0023E8256F|nr:hypothetical protein [Halorussus sp. DT80]
MAREHDTARNGDDESAGFDRRSYLRLAGTAIASSAIVGASGSAVAVEYDTVTVSAGDTRTFSVGSGETLENTLIDITADGASARIVTSGSGWTVRNVGLKGQHPGGHHQMIVRVDDPDGTGRLENVFLGNEQADRSAKGGIYWDSASSEKGTIVLDRVHIANKVDNGFYGEGDGYGHQIVKNCYFHNNTISNVRVGSRHSTSRVVNTTVHIDGGNPPCGAGCSSPGSTNTRAIWAWFGEVHVEDCDIKGAPLLTKEGGSITQSNTRVGSAADTSPPEGVPMTAEEAASGGSSSGDSGSGDTTTGDGSSETSWDTITIDSDGGGLAPYEFTVSGEVQKNEDSYEDTVEGATASGSVGPERGVDSFDYTGEITAFSLDGPATVYRNGQEVNPATLGESETQLPNTLILDGTDSPNRASDYAFEVSGDLEKSAELGSINPYDSISGGTVEGRVIGGKDAYRYSGDITNFRIEGSLAVSIDDADDSK